MEKQIHEAKTNLENNLLSLSNNMFGVNNTLEDDLAETKLFAMMAKQVHEVESNNLDEELKKADLRKKKFELEEARRKSVRDAADYEARKEREEAEVAERKAKEAEREEKERAQEKKERRRWWIDLGVKVGTVVVTVGAPLVMFFASKKMEYVDNKIPTKDMSTLWGKMLSTKH